MHDMYQDLAHEAIPPVPETIASLIAEVSVEGKLVE